jgi:hypothetical protein
MLKQTKGKRQDRARPWDRQNGHVKSEQAEVERKKETHIGKRQQDRKSKLNGSKHSPNSVCSYILRECTALLILQHSVSR